MTDHVTEAWRLRPGGDDPGDGSSSISVVTSSLALRIEERTIRKLLRSEELVGCETNYVGLMIVIVC